MTLRGIRLLPFAAMLSASACGTILSAEEVPATMTNVTAESRAILQRAVSAALKRESVVLADDALVSDSTLTMEPARLRDPRGNLAQGRELRPPERFRLLKSGRTCTLVHESSGSRTVLTGVQCAPKG